MTPFLRSDNPQALVVGMIGVKLGERLLQIGCANGARLGAVAAKVGLSGRAAAVVPDEASVARANKGAAEAGALVEVEQAAPTQLPLEDAAFDIVVVDDTDTLLTGMSASDRTTTVREALRMLRAGGRLIVIGRGTPTGIAGWMQRGPARASIDVVSELRAGGFKAVRMLADREGLAFVEGVKPRTSKSEG